MVKKKWSVCVTIILVLSLLFSTNNLVYANDKTTTSEYTDNNAQTVNSTDTEGKQVYVYEGLSTKLYFSSDEIISLDKLNTDIAEVSAENDISATRWKYKGTSGGSYDGDSIAMSQCLHTFSKSGNKDNTYVISGISLNDNKKVYLNMRQNTGYGYPHSSNPDEITITYDNGHFRLSDVNDTKYDSTSEKGNLYFCSLKYFLNQEGYSSYMKTATKPDISKDFDIYKKSDSYETSDNTIKGYTKLSGISEIKDGGQYLIVSPMTISDESNYVLTPYSKVGSSDRYAHVSKVGTESKTVTTISAKLTGSTMFEANGEKYLIIIESRPKTPFISKQENSQALNNGVISRLTISGDTSYSLGISEAYSESNVKWTSSNPELVSVDQNGVITSYNDCKQLSDASFGMASITAEIDGKKYELPIIVVKWYKDGGDSRLNDIYIKGSENCKVYYTVVEDRRKSYSESDLVEAIANEETYVYSNVNENWGLDFFAAEDEGYALTEMAATGTNGDYFSMLGNSAEETEFYNSSRSPIYSTQKGWFGDYRIKQLLNAALEKKCVGANGYSRAAGITGGVNTTMYFRSKRIPTVSAVPKAIKNKNGEFLSCSDGAIVYPGETVYFMVTVKTYVNNLIVNMTDGAKPILKFNNNTKLSFKYYEDPDAEPDSSSFNGKKMTILEGNPTELDLTNYLSKDTTSTNGKEYKFFAPYTVTAEDAQNNESIKCDLDFEFSYSSQYSAGSTASNETAHSGVVVYDEAVDDEVEVQGFQINTDTSTGAVSEFNPSFRTLSRTSKEMTINGTRYNVEKYGTIYMAESDLNQEIDLTSQLVINGENKKVHNFQATEAGRYNDYFSGDRKDACYYYYALTIKKLNYNFDSLQDKIYFRAYSVLSNGEIVYGKNIYKVSLYDIAQNLYENRKMLTNKSHDFLYNNILNIVSISNNYKSIGTAMLKAMNITSSKDENYELVNKCYKDLYYYTRCAFGYEYLTRGNFESISLTNDEKTKLLKGLNQYSTTSYGSINDWIYNQVENISNSKGQKYKGYYKKVDFNWDNTIYPGINS